MDFLAHFDGVVIEQRGAIHQEGKYRMLTVLLSGRYLFHVTWPVRYSNTQGSSQLRTDMADIQTTGS